MIYRMSHTTSGATKELASGIVQTAQGNVQHRTIEQYNKSEVVPRFLEYKPPIFTGSEDPEATEKWLWELERIFNLISYTDEQHVLCAVFQLKEDAYFYWWELIMTPEKQANLTWEQFKQILTEKYIPSSYFYNKEEEFYRLEQGIMTVTEYERLFYSLSRYASYLVDTDVKSAERLKEDYDLKLAAFCLAH